MGRESDREFRFVDLVLRYRDLRMPNSYRHLQLESYTISWRAPCEFAVFDYDGKQLFGWMGYPPEEPYIEVWDGYGEALDTLIEWLERDLVLDELAGT